MNRIDLKKKNGLNTKDERNAQQKIKVKFTSMEDKKYILSPDDLKMKARIAKVIFKKKGLKTEYKIFSGFNDFLEGRRAKQIDVSVESYDEFLTICSGHNLAFAYALSKLNITSQFDLDYSAWLEEPYIPNLKQ